MSVSTVKPLASSEGFCYTGNDMFPDVTIPVAVFLIPYALFMLFYLIYSLFNVYHLLRFGVYSFGAYVITVVFAGGTIFFIGASLVLLSGYDWGVLWNATRIFQGSPNDLLEPL
jgi:hypothetical protein